jgi:hypothetical protein
MAQDKSYGPVLPVASLENPVPSQAGHLISATASFDLSLFIKIALQKEPWYPSRTKSRVSLAWIERAGNDLGLCGCSGQEY